MALCKVNFVLGEYTPPPLDQIDFGLSVYAPVLDGDDFALIIYTPPALDAVNFALTSELLITIRAKEFPMHYHEAVILAKILRSLVSGTTPTKKANTFPHLVVRTDRQKELISDYA